MTDRTLQLYNSNRVYYSLERDIAGSSSESSSSDDLDNGDAIIGDTEILPLKGNTPSSAAAARIDNPDQRITEDVRISFH